MCLFFSWLRSHFLESSGHAKFCMSRFLAKVWAGPGLSSGNFVFSCSFDLFVFVKDGICKFFNRLKIGVVKKNLLILEQFQEWWTARGCQLIFKTCQNTHWRKQMVKVRFIIFSICLVRRQEVDKAHISFFSKFLPFRLQCYIGGGEKRLHVSTFIPYISHMTVPIYYIVDS